MWLRVVYSAFRSRVWFGRGDQNIRLGLGRSSWSTIHWFDGVPWERDRVATRERVVFSRVCFGE